MTDDAMVRREAAEIDAAVAGQTIVDVFKHNASRFADRPAVHWRVGDEWRSINWSQYRSVVLEFAAGLQTLGLDTGGFAAIQAGNRPEHAIADLAAIHLGATGVTVYSTLAAQQVAYIANDCGATIAILEDLSFMKRWEGIRPQVESLQYVVLLEGAENYSDVDWVLSWDEVIERGRERLGEDPEIVDVTDIEPASLATLIYTSGTTGNPKGVMITHRNVMWTAESARLALGVTEHPRMVSYLPLAHIAERISSHYLGIYMAGEVWYCPDMAEVLEYIQRARPTIFVGVPRVWEKFATRLNGRFAEAEGIKGKLLHKALEVGAKRVEAEQAGRRLSGLDGALAGSLDRIVLSKVREQLGMDQVNFAITAAAPIAPDLVKFFHSIGVPLYEVYGMSENTGPATANVPHANRIGSVGIPIPGVEVELGQDGEVLMRGGIIADGYYNLPEETEATFDPEGWLHSGDLGRIDEDGFLHIVGRKKEIIITAAGKNIAPAKLETLLGNHALISKACMVGDGRKFLTMVIALDAEEAPLWAEAHGVEYVDLASFSKSSAVVTEIESAVEAANQEVSRAEQVKKHLIVPDEWTPDSGEITPSLKLKRRIVLDKYASEIDEMYAD